MRGWRIKIMGATWVYNLYSRDGFLKLHPDCANDAALILPKTRQIHFCQGEATLEIVRHEVRHAFIAELCLDSTDLTIDQFEEIQCTLDERRWDDLNNTSQEIFKKIKSAPRSKPKRAKSS